MKLEIKDVRGRILQTVDLGDGEYTLSVTSTSDGAAAQVTASGLQSFGKSLALFLFCALIFSFNQYFEKAHENRENIVVLKSILEMLSSVAFSVGLLSLISRALTHKYQVWRCCNFVLCSFLGYFFWSENLLGLRWFFPKIFWVTEVYNLLFVIWAAAALWYLMKILLYQLHPLWRKAFVTAFVSLVVIYNAINFLPFRREYNYYRINTPPPRPPILESSPVTLEKFLAEIPEDQSGAN